jgi:ATP-dependent Clp protease ATP-binding subunit ClpC
VVPLGDLPYTPRAKRALELSLDEAHRLGHVAIDEAGRVTGSRRLEHMLLGLLREEESVAGRVLRALGVDLEATRREVRSLA